MLEVTDSANHTQGLMTAIVYANGGRLGLCRFEYGTTLAYGGKAQCGFGEGTLGTAGSGCKFPPSPEEANCEFSLTLASR